MIGWSKRGHLSLGEGLSSSLRPDCRSSTLTRASARALWLSCKLHTMLVLPAQAYTGTASEWRCKCGLHKVWVPGSFTCTFIDRCQTTEGLPSTVLMASLLTALE